MPTPKEIIHDISHSANTPYAKTFEKMIERGDDRGALQPKFQVVNMMPEDERVYMHVPFEQKQEARDMGAVWDATECKWSVHRDEVRAWVAR